MKKKIKLTLISFAIFTSFFSIAQASDPYIQINEVAWMGTTISANSEWIELKNNTAGAIDLTGWTLSAQDGTPHISLTGNIPANGYFLLERTSDNTVPTITADQIYVGALGNSGEVLELRNATNDLIDTINASAGWPAGDNTQKLTMEKIAAGWQNSALVGGTPKVINSGISESSIASSTIATSTSDTTATSTNNNQSQNTSNGSSPVAVPIISSIGETLNLNYKNLLITEIYPDPPGSDLENEFIELYNKGDESVNLSGFKIGDDTNRVYAIKDKIILPKEYWAINRSESKMALNNDKDSVNLYAPGQDLPFIKINFTDVKEGFSYNLDFARLGVWAWSSFPTPGKANIIKEENIAPVAIFALPKNIALGNALNFDATDSYDLNGDLLTYSWDFGDGFNSSFEIAEHTYLKTGNFQVKLIVNDGKLKQEKIAKLEVIAASIVSSKKIVKIATSSVAQSKASSSKATIIISEIMPNPQGADEKEWLELFNTGKDKVNLAGWSIDNKAGGSKPYEIEDDLWIAPTDYLVFYKEDTKLVFNNTADQARLFDADGQLADQVDYTKAKEGMSYAKIGKVWTWSTLATPGEQNQIPDNEIFSNNFITEASSTTTDAPIDVALEDVKQFAVGDSVRTAGIVAVLPGVFGVQYFYIVDENAGIQIYSNKKSFPKLNIGDYVAVTGELSQTNNELRLKITKLEDIKKIRKGVIPAIDLVGSDDINETLVGQLKKIQGVITEKKGSTIYLDDGGGEIQIYLKKGTGIKAKNIIEGKNYTITGVFAMTSAGIKLMPRSFSDLALINEIPAMVETEAINASSTLAKIDPDNVTLAANSDNKETSSSYLKIIGGVATLASLAWVYTLDKK
ncbi:MAG: lamin tail domain-containing protein [Candidatus Falkowbacteria bacterium]|nr:lamin tail domain-containing protein [Candidatus Falkowbacteria bacterium]